MPTINIPDLTERNKIGVDAAYPLKGDYLQTAEIDGTAGVLVIGTGTGALRFAGTYDGGGFKTINVTINNPTLDYQGLFGSTVGATISNIADVAGSITGKDYVGGIVGRSYTTSAVSLCKCSAAVSGASFVGGAVGQNLAGTLTNCICSNTVSGANYVGGAVGQNLAGTLTNCISVVTVTASGNYPGWMVGRNDASIFGCFALNIGTPLDFVSIAGASRSVLYSTGITVPQAKDPLLYITAAWDFAATWVLPIVMPNIVGQTVPTATALLTAQGCTLSVTSSVYHATVPAGQILTQSIAAGGTAGYPQLQAHGMPDSPRTGDVVAVTVSLGNQVEVQNTLGLTQAAAEALLTADDFTVTVQTATSETVAAGLVSAQDPAGGTEATFESDVEITVSTGHANVSVPNVVGATLGDAVDTIEAANLATTISSTYSGTVALGYVISQIPAADESVAYGSEIAVLISLGVQTVEMPDVVALTQAAAVSAIEGVGLVASISTAYSGSVTTGKVISQVPDAGVFIETGSDVCIVVSLGVQPAIVPNVVGKYYLAAQALIEDESLVYASTTAYSATVASGYIISQSPAAGASVATGSTVTATISRGAQVGPLMYTLNTVKTVLSRSSAFRTWAGVATEALALGHIGILSMVDDYLPMAVISPGNWEREVVTLDGSSLTKPAVIIEFCKGVTRTDSDATVFATLIAAVDSIMLDIEAQGLWINLKWAPLNEDTPRRAGYAATNADWVGFSIVIEGDENEEI